MRWVNVVKDDAENRVGKAHTGNGAQLPDEHVGVGSGADEEAPRLERPRHVGEHPPHPLLILKGVVDSKLAAHNVKRAHSVVNVGEHVLGKAVADQKGGGKRSAAQVIVPPQRLLHRHLGRVAGNVGGSLCAGPLLEVPPLAAAQVQDARAGAGVQVDEDGLYPVVEAP